ncbi:MAG: hypothetical protein HN919_17160 [Verrucomicrobia bacterium]|jgi:hypothetical protein|nr:hypothetical protein [Verrucomicrobiota bacterium]MBT7068031.1 hypothetical protein [Verrucomicrobiota bacterium]MBT7699166.1 hypothetical protein [Verrucomicrobiota bacterium]
MKKMGVYLTCAVLALTAGCGESKTPPTDVGIGLERTHEPREHAFTLLVPNGWQIEGGIFRVNAAQAGGPLNALEAKCNLTLRSDATGTVAMRILPDIVYAHAGIGAGMWGRGSTYQGAEVRAIENAQSHLKALFHAAHPTADNVTFIKEHSLPGEIESMNRGAAYMNALFQKIGIGHMRFRHDAAGAVIEYDEAGQRFREVWLTGIVDQRAAMTWKNTRTLSFRAPVESFDRWRPIMDAIRFSIRFNPQWVLKEAEGQQQRADYVMKILEEGRRIDREIAQNTTVTREEIMNDNFLVLTGQEEFINQHTGEVETDTDAFRYRWTTDGGDVYYTDEENIDPNDFMQRTDYKRSPIRPRRGGAPTR